MKQHSNLNEGAVMMHHYLSLSLWIGALRGLESWVVESRGKLEDVVFGASLVKVQEIYN